MRLTSPAPSRSGPLAAVRRAIGALALTAGVACVDSVTGPGTGGPLRATGPASVTAFRSAEAGGPTWYECPDVALRLEALGRGPTVVGWRGVWFSQRTTRGVTEYRKWFPASDLAGWVGTASLRAGEARELAWTSYAPYPHRVVVEIEYTADGRDGSTTVEFDCH